MNVISYNDNDLQTLYNKYKMSTYNPGETMKTNTLNNPNYTALNSHNLLLNSNHLNNNNTTPLNNNRNNPNSTAVKIRIPAKERNRQELLKESDKLFDDLELYGLILTNDLLKLRRLQQMVKKNDFSLQFTEFRNRLYSNVDSTGDKMVTVIKEMNEEFVSLREQIENYLKRNLNKNSRSTNHLGEALDELKENLTKSANNLSNKYKVRTERFKALKYYLYPPKVESGIVVPPELTIDWDGRLNRLRSAFAFRKLNDDLQTKIDLSKQKLDLMNKVSIKEDRVRNIKFRDLEKEKKQLKMNFLREQEQRDFDMMEELDKFQKELEVEDKKRLEELMKQRKEMEEAERKRMNEEKKQQEENEKKPEEELEEDEESEDDEDEKETSEIVHKPRSDDYDYTDVITKGYRRSEKISDISPLAPASIFKERDNNISNNINININNNSNNK